MASRWNNKQYYHNDPQYQMELDLQDIRRVLVYLLDEPDDEECFICNRLRCRCAEYTLSSFRTSPSDMGIDFLLGSSTDSISDLDYSYVSSPDTSSYSEIDYVDFMPPPVASSSFEDLNDITSAPNETETFPTPPPANALPTPPWQCKGRRSTQESELKAYYDDLLQWVQASHPEIKEGGPDMRFPINESINNEINMSWPPHPKSIWRYPQPVYDRTETLFHYYRTYTRHFYNEFDHSDLLYHQFFL